MRVISINVIMQVYKWQTVACREQDQAAKHAGERSKKQTWLIRAQRFMYMFSYYTPTKLICITSLNSERLMTDRL
jgi:hypothetical protein